MVLGQAADTLRQLHQRLTDFVGSEGVAQAIEGGAALFIVLLVLIYLRGRFSSSARRRRASRRRFQALVKIHRLPAADRQLLTAMARHLDLDEPGILFVRRSVFETAAAKGGFKADRVEIVRRELFS